MSLQMFDELSETQRKFFKKNLPVLNGFDLFERQYSPQDLHRDVLRNFSNDFNRLHGSVARALINNGIIQKFHSYHWLTGEIANAWGYPTYSETDEYFTRLAEQVKARERAMEQRNAELPPGQRCAYNLATIGFSDYKTLKVQYDGNYVPVLAIVRNEEDANNADIEFADLRMLVLVLAKHDAQDWEIVPIEIKATTPVAETIDGVNLRGAVSTLNAGRQYDYLQIKGFSKHRDYRTGQVCFYELAIHHSSSNRGTEIRSVSGVNLTPEEAVVVANVLQELVGISQGATENMWDMIETYTTIQLAY